MQIAEANFQSNRAYVRAHAAIVLSSIEQTAAESARE